MLRAIVWVGLIAIGVAACGGDEKGAQSCPVGAMVGARFSCTCDNGSMSAQECGADMKLTECACTPQPCPMGALVGSAQPCTCLDGVTMGMAMCGADMNLTMCVCTAPMATGGTMAPAGMGVTGGTGMTGGTGITGGMGPTGGTGMMTPDSGMMMTPDGGGMADGDQLAPCMSDSDCSGELVCYVFGGFCTEACADDTDCSGISGATYTCFTGGGMGGGGGACRIECDGGGSCPDGLECVDLGGAMGGSAFRCIRP